jgi:hypothetical protein
MQQQQVRDLPVTKADIAVISWYHYPYKIKKVKNYRFLVITHSSSPTTHMSLWPLLYHLPAFSGKKLPNEETAEVYGYQGLVTEDVEKSPTETIIDSESCTC